jgi:hypothetical protein
MARKEDSQVTKRVSSRMELTSLDIFEFPRRPKNILWYLVHRFLFRGLRITRLEVWDTLLKRYVNDPKNGVKQTPEARTSARGNLTSQIFSEEEAMSIGTFVNAAVVAGAVELELMAIWKMGDGKRLVGKVRYPLTPDVLMSLKDEDDQTKLIADVNELLQRSDDIKSEDVKKLLDKMIEIKKKKNQSGESNA